MVTRSYICISFDSESREEKNLYLVFAPTSSNGNVWEMPSGVYVGENDKEFSFVS